MGGGVVTGRACRKRKRGWWGSRWGLFEIQIDEFHRDTKVKFGGRSESPASTALSLPPSLLWPPLSLPSPPNATRPPPTQHLYVRLSLPLSLLAQCHLGRGWQREDACSRVPADPTTATTGSCSPVHHSKTKRGEKQATLLAPHTERRDDLEAQTAEWLLNLEKRGEAAGFASAASNSEASSR